MIQYFFLALYDEEEVDMRRNRTQGAGRGPVSSESKHPAKLLIDLELITSFSTDQLMNLKKLQEMIIGKYNDSPYDYNPADDISNSDFVRKLNDIQYRKFYESIQDYLKGFEERMKQGISSGGGVAISQVTSNLAVKNEEVLEVSPNRSNTMVRKPTTTSKTPPKMGMQLLPSNPTPSDEKRRNK